MHRHGANQRVDGDVEDHPQLDDARNAELAGLPEDADREERRNQVAEAGHQAENRIEADAVGRARNDECRIQQLRDLAQRLESLHLARGQLPEAGNRRPHISILGAAFTRAANPSAPTSAAWRRR